METGERVELPNQRNHLQESHSLEKLPVTHRMLIANMVYHTIRYMQQYQRFLIRVVEQFFLGLLLLSTAGCTTATPNDAELQATYRNAAIDAQISEPDEISRNLEAIVYYNPNLTWEGQPGASRVLLLTWTS